MKAIVLGATGAVGLDLVEMLLKDDAFSEVEVFVRRAMPMENAKLTTHIVNFKQPNEWQDMIKGDVVFSCMGTTLKAAGSKERQYEIDYTYQLEFAQAAHSNGVAAYILVSSAMASAKSKFFYTRMKGELEDAIHQEVIMRPPSLIRKNTTKINEKIAVAVLKVLNALGLFKKQRPMPTEVVAKAMIVVAKKGSSGVFESTDIWNLAK
ncbi:MAG: NAD(P)H-binding protein [Prevotella nanceiensis]|nr:NAD(P)H-binding protein [Hoylesella nanceiensis]